MDENELIENELYYDIKTHKKVRVIKKTINIEYVNIMGVVIEYNDQYPIIETVMFYYLNYNEPHVLTLKDFLRFYRPVSELREKGIDIVDLCDTQSVLAQTGVAGLYPYDGFINRDYECRITDDMFPDYEKYGKHDIWDLDKPSPREQRINAVEKFNSKSQKKFRTGRK